MAILTDDYPSTSPVGEDFTDYDATYEFDFYCGSASEVRVKYVYDGVEKILQQGVQCDIRLNAGGSGGYVTINKAAQFTEGHGRVFIYREIVREQRNVWESIDAINVEVIEGIIDRLCRMVSDLRKLHDEHRKALWWRGDWESGQKYLPFDMVQNDVSLYMAVKSHTAGSSVAADVTAGNLVVVMDGGHLTGSWYGQPVLSPPASGDEGKTARVNAAGDQFELSQLIPNPGGSSSGSGTQVAAPINEAAEFGAVPGFRSAHLGTMRFYYYSAYPQTLYFAPSAYRTSLYNHGEFGSDYGSQYTIAVPDATDTWAYLYVAATGSIAAKDRHNLGSYTDDFIFSTTQPYRDAVRGGYFNGEHRCVFAVYLDSSGNMRPFNHCWASGLVLWEEYIRDVDNLSVGTSWMTATISSIPPISYRMQAHFFMNHGTGANKTLNVQQCPDITTGTGHRVLQSATKRTRPTQVLDMHLNNSHQLVMSVTNGPASVYVDVLGWFLWKGA